VICPSLNLTIGYSGQRLLNRWTLQLDLGCTTGGLERVVSVHTSTLKLGLDVGQGITVGPGKIVKKNKRRALNKRRA
jgi:hypothetical protein